MHKLYPLCLLLILVLFVSNPIEAQVVVSGTIQVPAGEDPQGIYVFNKNSKKGSVSNEAGEFSLPVKAKDSVQVISLLFQEFTIVIDEGIIASKKLNIYVNEVVNPLPEVVVTPYDLTGNVNVDVRKITTANLPVNLTAKELANLNYEANTGSSIYAAPRNIAMNNSGNQLVHGLNFVNLFKTVLISSKKDQVYKNDINVDEEVRKLYNDEFFQQNFDIEISEVNNFILYADANGLDEEMLKKGNELDLIEFLLSQSKKFKRQLRK